MKSPKIIIRISGGVLQDVHVTHDLLGTQVVIVDYDNLDVAQHIPDSVKLAESEIENKQVIEIA